MFCPPGASSIIYLTRRGGRETPEFWAFGAGTVEKTPSLLIKPRHGMMAPSRWAEDSRQKKGWVLL
jgi:hypothetical protein